MGVTGHVNVWDPAKSAREQVGTDYAAMKLAAEAIGEADIELLESGHSEVLIFDLGGGRQTRYVGMLVQHPHDNDCGRA